MLILNSLMFKFLPHLFVFCLLFFLSISSNGRSNASFRCRYVNSNPTSTKFQTKLKLKLLLSSLTSNPPSTSNSVSAGENPDSPANGVIQHCINGTQGIEYRRSRKLFGTHEEQLINGTLNARTNQYSSLAAPTGGVGSLISQSAFDQMLKHRNHSSCPGKGFYTYNAFITAARSFNGFATVGDNADCKREIAAFLAQTSHETTGGWSTAPDGPYAWGYCYLEEQGSPPDYCAQSAQWPCASGKKYYGRGPIQISYNYNYGPAGRAIGADLLNNPEVVVTDPIISFKTAFWFWMTPQSPNPSCHDVITSRWSPSNADRAAGRLPGFGATINIINGGIECGKGSDNSVVADRIGFYKRYCDILGVSYGENLDCHNQSRFGALNSDTAPPISAPAPSIAEAPITQPPSTTLPPLMPKLGPSTPRVISDPRNGELHSLAKKKPFIIGGAILGVLLFTAAIVFIFFLYRRRSLSDNPFFFWNKKTHYIKDMETFLKNNRSLAPKRYSYSEIKKMTNSFRDKIGQGGYGGVFKGKLPNGVLVAVKVLSESKGNGEEFTNEVASIGKTYHVNVVTLLGYSFEGSKRALIYEYMPNGSLDKYIYGEKPRNMHPLGWEKLYQIALDVARGLEYLHLRCNTRILHLDIKPQNILLDQDFRPKISDFGLAKLCSTQESAISKLTPRGTIGYTAPEVFYRNIGGVSYKSDVYSYGMMVLEMVGGRKNINAEVATSEIYYPQWIYNHLNQQQEEEEDCDIRVEGLTSSAEGEMARKMILVGLWCIQMIPADRPSMSKVVEMLQGSIESLQMPPNPFSSLPS